VPFPMSQLMQVYMSVWDAEWRSGCARAGDGSTSRSTVAARVPPLRQPTNRHRRPPTCRSNSPS
jgi:hypothetical protein